MNNLLNVAPSGGAVTAYDRYALSLYAALLDANDSGKNWREVVVQLMHLDPDSADAELCWRSHLDRARWITGQGLPGAIASFGEQVR